MARHDPTREPQPRDPDEDEDEAMQRELHLARAQGDAYGEAVRHLTAVAMHPGDQQRAGEYWIGYTVQRAAGMYEWVDDQLVWREPGDGDLHLEITVQDAGDRRFVPCALVLVTVIDRDEAELGTHVQPLLWHPHRLRYASSLPPSCDRTGSTASDSRSRWRWNSPTSTSGFRHRADETGSRVLQGASIPEMRGLSGYQPVMPDTATGASLGPTAPEATRIFLRPIASPFPLGFMALSTASLLVAGLELGWFSPRFPL